MSARVAMLRMQGDGLISLPLPRYARPDPTIHIPDRTAPGLAIEQPAGALPGTQLRYFVYAQNQSIALLGFGAAAWQTAPRDLYIGWSHEQRKKNLHLHLIVNNPRFLILPWVQSKNLASMILSKAAKRLPNDWQAQYNYRPVLLETFVEKPCFKGTCYKAANWKYFVRSKDVAS